VTHRACSTPYYIRIIVYLFKFYAIQSKVIRPRVDDVVLVVGSNKNDNIKYNIRGLKDIGAIRFEKLILV